MSLTMLLFLLAVFTGGPALFLGVLSHYRRLTVRLEQHGLRVQGKVVRVNEGRGKPSTVYYAFSPPDGPELSGKFDEATSVASKRTPGSPVDILYLAEAPEQHMAVGMGFTQGLYLLLMVPLVGFSIMGVLSVLHAYFTQR
ncbi:DUF3592 domain-containing protein [Corallococcus sp. AB038B]|uniref:DUF3592 domain-containing protein n=1 Tax=Corallococcus sp. AB038B TaxID=2316718 RepID=UPI000EE5A53B|nr:DUF3592 domain-containing protein [Corallococcus sp. AB038B]RKI01742.1 hypothetical protein D7Y04_14625 [Corallococcus sp. AB038B]